MASLFNNENSLLLRVLCRIINEIHDGRQITRREAETRIHKAFPLGESIPINAENELIDVLFPTTTGKDKILVPFYNATVPSILTDDERLWLKTMLTDEAAAFLLSDDLRKKLMDRLSDTPDFSTDGLWEKRQAKGDDPRSEPLKARLTLLWKALREKKQIHYVNIDRSGIRHDRTLAPCRLSYDAAGNRYYLIVWDENENRAVRVNPLRLESLEITKLSIPTDTEEKYQDFLETREATVTFRLIEKEESSAFDRCFSLFAAYDKESFAEEDGTYTIKVHYKNFDHREIIARILSLGAYAVVLDPPEIREEIIDRLKNAWSLYREEQ